MAARIPGAQFIELPGEDHLPFVGDQESILRPVEEFLLALSGTAQTQCVLATVLAADFSGGSHFEAAPREHFEAFGASEAEYAWPRVTAAFHGPVRALQCAAALSEAARVMHAQFRIGLHTGELISRPGAAMGGSAVVIARRLLEKGAADQVLATGTLRDLVAGSGIDFTAMGRLEAPGLGEWQLLQVQVPFTNS